MSKLRAVKCQRCGQQIDREKEPFEKASKGYYHKTCHSELMMERAGREDLLSYISSLLGPEANLAFVSKQIKQFTEKYHLTHSGIKGTLYYLTEIKQVKLKPKMGLGLVPYEYQNARKYFEGLEKVKEGIKPYEELPVRVVVIEQKETHYKKRHVKDLDKMFEEDFLEYED